MAQNMVDTLFGPMPYEIEQARRQSDYEYAKQLASMSGKQKATLGVSQGAAGLTRALGGMAGMVDPAIEQANARNMAMSGVDPSSSRSLMEAALRTQDPRLKMQLTMLAQQRKAEEQKQAMEAQKMVLANRKQDFTEEEAMNFKRQQLAQSYEIAKMRSEDSRLAAQDRAAAAREANQIRLMIAQMSQAVKQGGSALGKPPPGYRWTPEGNQEVIPGGPKDMSVKNKALADTLEVKAKTVTSAIDEALNKTGFFTTGLTGEVLGSIPGTSAYDLDATLDTVKANIGFNELQAMRQASPTGGALGQVAVRELDMLQAVLGSLKKGQKEATLRKNLNAVKTHYMNWKKAVDQSASQEGGASPTSTPDMPPPGAVRRKQ